MFPGQEASERLKRNEARSVVTFEVLQENALKGKGEAQEKLNEVVEKLDHGEGVDQGEAIKKLSDHLEDVDVAGEERRDVRATFNSAEVSAGFEGKLRAQGERLGVQVKNSGARQHRVWIHDVPPEMTMPELGHLINEELADKGVDQASAGEIEYDEEKGMRSYRSRRDVKKAMVRLSDRIRYALHNKCKDRVRRGGAMLLMRVEDAGGPAMCFKCCSFDGHKAPRCRAVVERCAFCCGTHQMNKCTLSPADRSDPGKLRCGACGVTGHSAHEVRRCARASDAWNRWSEEKNAFLTGPSPIATSC